MLLSLGSIREKRTSTTLPLTARIFPVFSITSDGSVRICLRLSAYRVDAWLEIIAGFGGAGPVPEAKSCLAALTEGSRPGSAYHFSEIAMVSIRDSVSLCPQPPSQT